MTIRGKVHKYGDNVDTDVIIPGRYCHITDTAKLAEHALEDLDPEFIGRVQTGDILVAGNNFGCGSSREVAPLAIKSAGVACVIAENFARIFYRNAINIGLPILESPAAVASIEADDEVEVDLSTGEIKNLTKGTSFEATPFPEFVRKIIDLGGLINYVKDQIASGSS